MIWRFSHRIWTVVVLLSAVTKVEDLKCYKCRGLKECNLAVDVMKQQACEKLEQVCTQKILTKDSKVGKAGQVDYRDCGCDFAEEPMCMESKNASIPNELCLCQGDLCNGELPPCGIRHGGCKT